jgi:beta-lactamase class D
MGGSKTTLMYSKLITDWSDWTTDQKLNYCMKNSYKNYFLF